MKPAPRLFVDASLGAGPLSLTSGHAQYLHAVLRHGPGDTVRLFNGYDGEWLYRIMEISKRAGSLEPVERRRTQPEPVSAPVLLFAPVKRGPTEMLVQKATELGVHALQPVITQRVNRERLRVDRLEAIAIEAAEQCERLTVPSVAEPMPMSDALAGGGAFIFCDEAGDDDSQPWGGDDGRAGLADHVFRNVAETPERVLIGPEGGFTPEERDGLRADPRSVPISLGARILRAETAAIVALTLWQLRFGDFR